MLLASVPSQKNPRRIIFYREIVQDFYNVRPQAEEGWELDTEYVAVKSGRSKPFSLLSK